MLKKLALGVALAPALVSPAGAAQWCSGGVCAPGVVLENGSGSLGDYESAPFAGAVAMTVGATYAAQRSVGVLGTVAGNVVFQFPDGSTLPLPVYVGWQTFPFAVTQIVAAGTTATATYYNLK